jgi:hypothetical protein
VYDMYPWNQPASHDDPRARVRRARTGRATSPRRAAKSRRPAPAGPAAAALQVALDRRDNGGASPAADDQ